MTDERDTGLPRPGDIVVPIEDSLDLHPFRPREIRDVVLSYLEAADEAGYREVRLIHGRGIGVQREIVRGVLRRHPRVTAFGDAPPGRGGWGATVVRLGSDPETAAAGTDSD